MTLKEMRKVLAEQINLVRKSADNIPQAESISNLAGKTIIAIQTEIEAEVMRTNGQNFSVLDDILEETQK